ncbi:hypothetical protein [Kocuria sp.]|uniref:hypothetical protein n=1 Tax=Kocuria sp. TaxID=1871328 RepID=UPI0026E06AE0|nr:hypothetical protein [Kocuria sp.]MDO5618313.1 hypothetical protein [Kocuria sp.]
MKSTAMRRLRVTGPGQSAQVLLAERLRQQGLPLVVRPSQRRRELIPYTGPMLVVLGLLLLTQAIGLRVLVAAERRAGVDYLQADTLPDDLLWTTTIVAGVVLVIHLCSPLMLWAVALVVRRGRTRVRAGVVLAGLLITLLAVMVAPWEIGLGINLLTAVTLVAALLVGAYLGLGVITLWSIQRIIQELQSVGAMVIRALPLLMLVLLFLFYNSNIWQIAGAISWLNITLTAVVLLVLANVLNMVLTAEIVRGSHLQAHLKSSATPPRLMEQANILAVPTLVVTIQAGIFSLLVFAFLVGFGMLSIPVATIAQWTGQAPHIVFPWLMPGLPLSQELLKVCLVLAAFAGLNFVASMTTDHHHRKLFMQGVLDELEEGLKVREQYLR